MKVTFGSKPLLLAGLMLLAAPSVFAAGSATKSDVANPAGIDDYSYIQIMRIDQASSDYLGDSVKGNGAKFSFLFTKHAYFYGSYARLSFDDGPGYLYRTGVGLGYKQTIGRVSAYLRIGYYRGMLSASRGGARSYYFEPAYGVRGAFGDHFYLQGELYTDIHPEFGSRPWGIKFGAAVVLGPVSLHLVANHNNDFNSLVGALRVSF